MNDFSNPEFRQRMNEQNQRVIAEYRATGNSTAPTSEGTPSDAPLLLLTTRGAKTGREHITPLRYLQDGDHAVVFASAAGSVNNPAWYHNLVANPTVRVEVGNEAYEAKAVVAARAERDRLYALQCIAAPQFAGYEAKTTRLIPVIILQRLSQ